MSARVNVAPVRHSSTARPSSRGRGRVRRRRRSPRWPCRPAPSRRSGSALIDRVRAVDSREVAQAHAQPVEAAGRRRAGFGLGAGVRAGAPGNAAAEQEQQDRPHEPDGTARKPSHAQPGASSVHPRPLQWCQIERYPCALARARQEGRRGGNAGPFCHGRGDGESAGRAIRTFTALRASGQPASFSRTAIGAFSGNARLDRRTMKVCSSMYWPLRQAWLVPSVKTIQVDPAGNSHRSLRQVCWKPASSFMAWWNRSMKRSYGGRSTTGRPSRAAARTVRCLQASSGPGRSAQANSVGESAGQGLEGVGGDPDPRAIRMDVGKDPQQPVAVRRPGRERVEVQQVIPRMQRGLAPLFLDRPEAGVVDLPGRGISVQQR